MATFWCPSCTTTFKQDALSEEGIACPHCHTELHPVVKVADISALRGQPRDQPVSERAESSRKQ
jgi:Zn finger protein HypA/HybF involved in hydrogenase expression